MVVQGGPLTFLIHGSSGRPYQVVVHRLKSGKLELTCGCRAGDFGPLCKHRLTVLKGEFVGLVSDSGEAKRTLHEWLVGSKLEAAVAKLQAVESAYGYQEWNLKKAKEAIVRALGKRPPPT